jgi:hypothetical protein
VSSKRKAASKSRGTLKPSSYQKGSSAKKKGLRPTKAPKKGTTAPRGARLMEAAAPLSCPTHVYSGIVTLDDTNQRAFLQTQGGTYLLVLDPDCSGTFNAQRISAAYAAFSRNPGRNGQLTCNGFLHEDGTAYTIHVFS